MCVRVEACIFGEERGDEACVPMLSAGFVDATAFGNATGAQDAVAVRHVFAYAALACWVVGTLWHGCEVWDAGVGDFGRRALPILSWWDVLYEVGLGEEAVTDAAVEGTGCQGSLDGSLQSAFEKAAGQTSDAMSLGP
jgi:hypothetical protein